MAVIDTQNATFLRIRTKRSFSPAGRLIDYQVRICVYFSIDESGLAPRPGTLPDALVTSSTPRRHCEDQPESKLAGPLYTPPFWSPACSPPLIPSLSFSNMARAFWASATAVASRSRSSSRAKASPCLHVHLRSFH